MALSDEEWRTGRKHTLPTGVDVDTQEATRLAQALLEILKRVAQSPKPALSESDLQSTISTEKWQQWPIEQYQGWRRYALAGIRMASMVSHERDAEEQSDLFQRAMTLLIKNGLALKKEIDGEAYYRLAMDFTTLEELKHVISPYKQPASGVYSQSGTVFNVRIDVFPGQPHPGKSLIGTVPISQDAKDFFVSKNWTGT